MLMLTEVSGNSRPGRPVLAVVVSAVLLVSTLAGAAWLTSVRNRPIALGQPHRVEGIPGVLIAWPQNWSPVRPRALAGAPLTAYTDKPGSPDQRLLILLARRVSDETVEPPQAAEALLGWAGRQMGFELYPQRWMIGAGTMAGLPAFQISCPVVLKYPTRLAWLQLRAVSEPNGRAVALLLISPEQITPGDDQVMDAVGDSMQLAQSSPPAKSKIPPAEDEDSSPREPI